MCFDIFLFVFFFFLFFSSACRMRDVFCPSLVTKFNMTKNKADVFWGYFLFCFIFFFLIKHKYFDFLSNLQFFYLMRMMRVLEKMGKTLKIDYCQVKAMLTLQQKSSLLMLSKHSMQRILLRLIWMTVCWDASRSSSVGSAQELCVWLRIL